MARTDALELFGGEPDFEGASLETATESRLDAIVKPGRNPGFLVLCVGDD